MQVHQSLRLRELPGVSERYTSKERCVTSEQVAEVCSTIGNLVRIALAVELDEAQAACNAAREGAMETRLLDPRQAVQTPMEQRQNQRLLEAFLQVRLQLQIAEVGYQFDAVSPS